MTNIEQKIKLLEGQSFLLDQVKKLQREIASRHDQIVLCMMDYSDIEEKLKMLSNLSEKDGRAQS